MENGSKSYITDSGSISLDGNYTFNSGGIQEIDKILTSNLEEFNLLQHGIPLRRLKSEPLNSLLSNLIESKNQIVSQISLESDNTQQNEKDSITTLKKEITNLKNEIIKISNEVHLLSVEQTEKKSQSMIFDKALKYYSVNFNMTVEVESEHLTDKKLWVKVIFNTKANFFIRFLVNTVTENVEEFDASCFLSNEEENFLIENYKKTSNILYLLSELRNYVLSKQ